MSASRIIAGRGQPMLAAATRGSGPEARRLRGGWRSYGMTATGSGLGPRPAPAAISPASSAVPDGCGSKRTMATSSCKRQRCLSIDNMNPCVKVMEYAVRGPLVIRAGEIEKELEKVRFCPAPACQTAHLGAPRLGVSRLVEGLLFRRPGPTLSF